MKISEQINVKKFFEDMASKYYAELRSIDYEQAKDLYVVKLGNETAIIKLGLHIQSIHHYQHVFDRIHINNTAQKAIWIRGLYFDEDFNFIRYRYINGRWLQLPDISFRRDALEKTRATQVKESSRPKKEYGYIYFLLDEQRSDDNKALIKIGKTKNIKQRFSEIQCSNPGKLKLLGHIACYHPTKEEKRIHKKFGCYKHRGEWFEMPRIEIDKLNSLITPMD